MGDLLKETHSQVCQINDVLKNMQHYMEKNNADIKRRLVALEAELQEERAARLTSEAERARLQARNAELTQQLSASAWQGFRGKASQPPPSTSTPATPPPPPLPPRKLLLGNSLLRNIDPTRLTDTDVRALSGATVVQLTGEVKKLKRHDYSAIYIVVGTRELIETSEADVISQFATLMTAAMDITSNVTVCSIPHRIDKDLHVKTDNLNNEIHKLCESKDIYFANADEQLLLRDGSINEAALANDGIHLSRHGVDAITKSLQLPTVGRGSIYTPTIYPAQAHTKAVKKSGNIRYFKGKDDPLSNFFPCSIYSHKLWFHSTEQLVQYRRARLVHDTTRAQEIMEAADAPTVYAISKRLPRSPKWDFMKDQVLMEAAQLKLTSCDEFFRELMRTKGGRIIENTPDPYWGRGPDHKGLNRMGLILEAVRDGKTEVPPPSTTSSSTNRRSSFVDPRPQHTQRSSRRCGQCGESNHTTDRCWYDTKLRCDICHLYGHKSKNCESLN